MNFEYFDNTLIFHDVMPLELSQTLDCGQCFRWKAMDDGSYSGVAFSKSVNASIVDNTLIIKNAKKEDALLWADYFDLERDYEKISRDLSKLHPVLKEASHYAKGIRILSQEPFEALITFIISQNNNIKRIKGIVQRLCENFGEKLSDGTYAFVTSEKLSCMTADDLSVIRAGFRARYIVDAAKRIQNGEVNLEKIRTMPYDDAQKELMKITGVGTKVADCVLLFGLHRLEAFPLDVWMKRAMKVLFCDMSSTAFGENGGVAQQYIFHYSRMHKELFENE